MDRAYATSLEMIAWGQLSLASRFFSRSSRLRKGILSMLRVISRTSHGNGLRSFTPPSLPIIANMKPRGRSFSRNWDFALGSVSVKFCQQQFNLLGVSGVGIAVGKDNNGPLFPYKLVQIGF